MVQGTGSNVGKSLIVAGLARAFRKRGLTVAPFKPQNMSNNAAVTKDGGEIGRAQALQALAAGRAPTSDMNPILLKPESDTGSQLIVQGVRHSQKEACSYLSHRPNLLPFVIESFERLAQNSDLILIEGAGSPAETNLRKNDIANMGFATKLGLPVILVGDIERGGVSAQIVGTHSVMDAKDNAHICGYIINKFRGDVGLLGDLCDDIFLRTHWTNFGVLPWFDQAWKLPGEDILDITSHKGGRVKIAVPRLSRLANFDDLDPLAAEPSVTVEIVPPGHVLPSDAHLILLLGSKSTIADLEYLRSQGWDTDIAAHVRRGRHVIGLCGGFQMLGQTISDPQGLEGDAKTVTGLGYLHIHTELKEQKRLAIRRAICRNSNTELEGYEIHLGQTTGDALRNPWLDIDGQPEGAQTDNGQIRGSYLHGIFASDPFRAALLKQFGEDSRIIYNDVLEETLESLAAHIEEHLNLDNILAICKDLDSTD